MYNYGRIDAILIILHNCKWRNCRMLVSRLLHYFIFLYINWTEIKQKYQI